MKTLMVFIVLPLLMALVIGCDDDDEQTVAGQGTVIELYGKWEVVSGFSAVYINFNDDNTYDFLFEGDYGFRTTEAEVFLATADQVLFGWSVYNYSVNNDTLALWQLTDTVRAARNNSGPTVQQWISPLNPIRIFDAPVAEATDIAWHGDYLWYGNGYASNYLYKIDTASGLPVDSLGTNYYAWAVEWSWPSSATS